MIRGEELRMSAAQPRQANNGVTTLPLPIRLVAASIAGAMITLASELPPQALEDLLRPYGMTVEWIADGEPIPGSHWGESEAGLVGDHLYVRADTPVHSALHEACHFICMDDGRRASLHTDAGGADVEECAVCYLQILLADRVGQYSRERIFADMDAWGYSFRLGSARDWFEQDADDARRWLITRGLHP